MKELHLICNAHLDPVWQWDYEEGITSAIATFYSAAELAKQFDYIFCHNEAFLYEVVEKYVGTDLCGLEYEPLFTFANPDKKAYFVVADNYVTMSDGTGIVHIAPAFGEDDAKVGRNYDLPFVQFVDGKGNMTEETPYAGKFVKDADIDILIDLDKDGKFELIASKPITAAGKLFSNYRTYPQGEVHAMLWDGMGMNLLWKTRRIKGTVCDVAIADPNNNGKLDLVVAVNSYAGVMNGVKTRCALYLYPLDTTQVSGKSNYAE